MPSRGCGLVQPTTRTLSVVELFSSSKLCGDWRAACLVAALRSLSMAQSALAISGLWLRPVMIFMNEFVQLLYF